MAVISVEQNEISVRQNEIRQLTVIATVFLPLSVLTGFFGMNFGWLTGHISSFWEFLVFGLGSLSCRCASLCGSSSRRGYLSAASGIFDSS